MALERDFTIQQGDTKTVVIPVLDSDDPDQDFYPYVDFVDVTFVIAPDFDDSLDAIWVAGDEDIDIVQFDDVKLGSEAFDFTDIDTIDPGITIPDDQDVIIVEIPSDTTEAFITDVPIVYQCRLVDDSSMPEKRLTPVKGEITVEPQAPFDE